jgi:hypothetical protein
VILGVFKTRNGSVVQLVRMPPCHGGGRGFESRPVRTSSKKSWEFIFLKEFPNKSEALKFERRIKKWNRRSLYKLIESSENSLQKE